MWVAPSLRGTWQPGPSPAPKEGPCARPTLLLEESLVTDVGRPQANALPLVREGEESSRSTIFAPNQLACLGRSPTLIYMLLKFHSGQRPRKTGN